MLCLLLPVAAFAEDPIAPAADQPTQAALVPSDAAVQPAVAEARYCSAHRCGGGHAKWIVVTGVTATVLTAVAVGVAVGVANSRNQTLRP